MAIKFDFLKTTRRTEDFCSEVGRAILKRVETHELGYHEGVRVEVERVIEGELHDGVWLKSTPKETRISFSFEEQNKIAAAQTLLYLASMLLGK